MRPVSKIILLLGVLVTALSPGLLVAGEDSALASHEECRSTATSVLF